MNEVKRQKLRQEVGECFIEWADVYFANAENLNKRIPRKAMHLSFKLYAPEQAKYSTSQKFKRQLIDYCVLRGYKLNEFVQDSMGRNIDKEDGIEYFTISITSTHNTDILKRFIAQIKEDNNDCKLSHQQILDEINALTSISNQGSKFFGNVTLASQAEKRIKVLISYLDKYF